MADTYSKVSGIVKVSGVRIATTGLKGDKGLSLYADTGTPFPAMGGVGDSYVNMSTWDFYVKVVNGWTLRGSIKGDVGIQGVRGTRWFTGNTVPASATGSDGDIYYNTATYDLSQKTSGAWAVFANIRGPTGLQGSITRIGTVPPTDSTGIDGDIYINVSNGNLWQRVSGSYVNQGNIRGPAGINGSSTLTGAGVPAPGLGSNGDAYINTSNQDYYTKSAGSWTVIFNLKGSTGATGASLLNGTIAPTNALGKDGDSYLNTSTQDFYTRAAGSWTLQFNTKGSKGDAGAVGGLGAVITGTRLGFHFPIYGGSLHPEFGHRMMRLPTSLLSVWTSEGNANWAALDALLAKVKAIPGMGILWIGGNLPGWLTGGSTASQAGPNWNALPPTDRAKFRKLIADTVLHLRSYLPDRVIIWECWNEPNDFVAGAPNYNSNNPSASTGAQFFYAGGSRADQIAKLAEIWEDTWVAVKSADPTVYSTTPTLTGDFNYQMFDELNFAFEARGLNPNDYCDYVTFHPYMYQPPEGLGAFTRGYMAVAAKHNIYKPAGATEASWTRWTVGNGVTLASTAPYTPTDGSQDVVMGDDIMVDYTERIILEAEDLGLAFYFFYGGLGVNGDSGYRFTDRANQNAGLNTPGQQVANFVNSRIGARLLNAAFDPATGLKVQSLVLANGTKAYTVWAVDGYSPALTGLSALDIFTFTKGGETVRRPVGGSPAAVSVPNVSIAQTGQGVTERPQMLFATNPNINLPSARELLNHAKVIRAIINPKMTLTGGNLPANMAAYGSITLANLSGSELYTAPHTNFAPVKVTFTGAGQQFCYNIDQADAKIEAGKRYRISFYVNFKTAYQVVFALAELNNGENPVSGSSNYHYNAATGTRFENLVWEFTCVTAPAGGLRLRCLSNNGATTADVAFAGFRLDEIPIF